MLLTQTYIRKNGRTAHTVSALDCGTVALEHTGWEPAYICAHTHMTTDEAEELARLLTDAVQKVRAHKETA